MLWQVVPCARPDCVKSVVERFRRQTLTDAKLCLVVNGWHPDIDVEGYLKAQDCWPDLLLQTETASHGKAIALNAALDALQGELVAIRDDDDIQEPGDLEEALTAYREKQVEAIVKLPHRVILNGTLWVFAEALANTWAVYGDGTPDCRISGSNLLFHTSLKLAFRPVRAIESRLWAADLQRQGGRIWRTSPDNYTWIRGRGDHLWRATEVMVRHEYGMPEKGASSQKFVPARLARRFVEGKWELVQPPTLSELLAGGVSC